MRPIADILLEGGKYVWPGEPVARTDYPTLMFHGECEPPLRIGSEAKLGRHRLVVLVRKRGVWGWLRWAWWKVKDA
jgi:hypothetical protein